MPNAMNPFAASRTSAWNSPVVMFAHVPGPVLRLAITVSAPVRSRRSVSRLKIVSSSATVIDSPGVVYSSSMA